MDNSVVWSIHDTTCEIWVQFDKHKYPPALSISKHFQSTGVFCRPRGPSVSTNVKKVLNSRYILYSVGVAQTGGAPTTSEWSTILLPIASHIKDLTVYFRNITR